MQENQVIKVDNPEPLVLTPEQELEKKEKQKTALRLLIAQRRLARRQTKKISRLFNLLKRVNTLRVKLGLNPIELKDRFELGIK